MPRWCCTRVPYDSLTGRLAPLGPEVALLAVNGRRRDLSERNIAGNFSLTEAIELCGSGRRDIKGEALAQGRVVLAHL